MDSALVSRIGNPADHRPVQSGRVRACSPPPPPFSGASAPAAPAPRPAPQAGRRPPAPAPLPPAPRPPGAPSGRPWEAAGGGGRRRAPASWPRGRGAPGLPVGGVGWVLRAHHCPARKRDGVRSGRPAGRMSRPGGTPGSARPAPPRSMVVGALRPHSGRAPPWSLRSGDAGGSGRIGGLSSCRRVAAHGADCLGRGAELASPPDPATIGSAA